MLQHFRPALLGLSFLALAALSARAEPFSQAYPGDFSRLSQKGIELVKPLDFKTGKQPIGDGIATLDAPSGYFILNAADAQYMMTKIWKNPEDKSILGIIVPAGTSPVGDDGWAAVVTYDDIGYVSDTEAATYDYTSLLAQMKQDTLDANDWRSKNGYPAMQLIGWAAPPHYDTSGRKLYWAKELKFADQDNNTLNYNIRALGRHGVLVVNFIADIGALPQVEKALPDVLAMTSFTEGNRYQDFVPSLDKVATIGIAGLIAGKVAAKAGLLLLLLAFLKKGIILLLVPAIWLKNKLFRRTPKA